MIMLSFISSFIHLANVLRFIHVVFVLFFIAENFMPLYGYSTACFLFAS